MADSVNHENGPNISYCPAGGATRRFALTRAEGSCMQTHEIGPLIAGLLSELVDGAAPGGDAYILNSGDAGLLGSLDKLDAAERRPAARMAAPRLQRTPSTCG